MSSDAELNLILKAKNLAGREVDKLHGALGRLKTGATGVGGALGTLAKVGIAGLAVGLASVVAGLSLAVHAAAEEQIGITKLGAALKANVKDFDGNTDAIEAVIRKREDLAFSDDALRASLTTLVTKYHDVDQSLALQTTAMDVARLKGVSLEEATGMLTKGLDGNAKVLKQLGITLPKTATEQERLTAIQHAAAGQAEAYGKTAAGAQEAFGIAIGDVVEDLGGALLPIMTRVFTWLRVTGIPAVRDIIGKIQAWMTANKPLIDQLSAFVTGVLSTLITAIGRVVGAIAGIVGAIASSKPLMNFLRDIIGFIAKGFQVMTSAIQGTINKIASLIGWIQDAIRWLDSLNLVKERTTIGGSNVPFPSHQAGAWRTTEGLAYLHANEMVVPAGPAEAVRRGGSAAPSPDFVAVAVSRRDIARMVDEQLYFTLRRAAPTGGRI